MYEPTDHKITGNPAFSGALLPALAGTFVIYAINIATYTGTGIPNADDVMRLVTLRDLLAGQSWFDPVQHRLGLESGTLMHWSRLVDAPLMGFYALALMLTGNVETAETFAKFAWPATTLFIALLGVNLACNRLTRPQMRIPATIIATVCFMTIGIFGPGALDHHNIQVALSIWLFALLLPSATGSVGAHIGAGVTAVIMLAIGMETLPYVTVAGVWVAGAFLIGTVSPAAVFAFGMSFGVSSIALLFLTVDPAHYFAEYCDAYSLFHLGMCSAGGFGLAVASRFSETVSSRATGLVATACVVGTTLLLAFPQCLSNPLSSLDPLLVEFWLDGVVETRSVADLWVSDPFALFGMFGMALTGLIVSLYLMGARSGAVRAFAVLSAALLIVAIGVTAWQQRGSMFAASFAILPLAYVVADLRQRYLQTESVSALLKMVGVGVLSFNMLWWIVGANAAKLFSDAPTLQEQAASASARDYCYTEDVYAVLANEPEGVVLGATDIGASMLKYTNHRALAGPYHRNTGGNLAMIQTMLAPPDKAADFARHAGVTLIADCINSVDARDFKRASPDGLQAALHAGNVPDWLQRVEETAQSPLVLYRVRN